MELFVGRVDFARLPAFGTGDTAMTPEAGLLSGYLNKTHAYRHGTIKLAPRGVVYSTHAIDIPDDFKLNPETVTIYDNAIRNSSALYGTGAGTIRIGDPYFQKTDDYLFGFLFGPGAVQAISVTKPNPPGVGVEGDFMQHTTAQLVNSESKIGFYVLSGSYFADFQFNNDFMRASLATPSFGFAAVWTRGAEWEFQDMALGEPLGMGMLKMFNRGFVSTRWNTSNGRVVESILGDPTLRAHVIASPTVTRQQNESGSTVTLNISPGSGAAGCTYYVYRAQGLLPPANGASAGFSLISGANSISGPTFQSIVPDGAQEYTFMVRAVKGVTTGAGAFNHLSQGTYWVYDPTP